jgi:hypothetical protein
MNPSIVCRGGNANSGALCNLKTRSNNAIKISFSYTGMTAKVRGTNVFKESGRKCPVRMKSTDKSCSHCSTVLFGWHKEGANVCLESNVSK